MSCDITPVLRALRNEKCAALHLTASDKHLTEISCERVFICQTGEIHDSRGRLLVRIGKVTVVRRPLQSMVCSGRLTICDQKCMGPAFYIVYAGLNRAHVLPLRRARACASNLECPVHSPTISPSGALDAIAIVGSPI